MYNSETPLRAELPTSKQLTRSTMIAAVCAVALLATVVMPAEYGIDPTGAGRLLGLTEMGETKTRLIKEALADAAPAGAASAKASLISRVLVSPISVRPRSLPAPVGSMPYSAGMTTVASKATAHTAAIMVERVSCFDVGNSARKGVSLLYMFRVSQIHQDTK